ncbi:TPA: ATP-binding protein, partial [Streptococcus suis]
MTLKINIEKLNEEYIDTGYLSEEKEKINNLIKKVDNNNILISGFRGAGKSHFIDSIIKSYSEDRTKIFIKQNVNNYTEYNLLLRGLIRALFEELDLKKDNENSENVQKLLKDLEKLYKNTFYNVSEIFSTSKQETLLDSIKMESSVSKLVALLIPIASYVIVMFGSMKMNDILKAFLVFILSILTWIKYEKQYNRERTKISKEEYSTLYDDEIAEYRLFNLLKRLNDAGIKVIFIFDEVDKIENGDKLNKFYSDLKSLLLLEECSSLVIAGQSTYYEFEKSIFQEDSLLNNIFTTLIHISIVPTEFIKENIKTIFIDNQDPEIVEKYVYYLLFESSKIPRNLKNLLLNHVEFSTGRVTYFKSERLPNIYREIVELIESYLVLLKNDNVKKSVIDVVEIYSFIWMKKLLLFRNTKDLSFDKIDIFSEIQEK